MTNLKDRISMFYKKGNKIFKKPLEKIINIMLDKCKYINDESLERHNWGDIPLKLKNIPTDINSVTFEEDLLKSLDLDDNEKSIIELLWGDIQLGKRVQACIIMWISVYIIKRPVLYIFRNLCIDQNQLHDDIVGTEKYNFNIQFIKHIFDEFTTELQEYFNEKIDYWKDYKLPELKDINSNGVINKLNNKNACNSNDIFCCLMNHKQLAKINSKFSEYIYYNKELVNMTLLVDESDLMAPSSSNDRNNINDERDSTACELLLAKIYKKVKYTLHITGTAHSLLYNITTRLNDNNDIQIKISKVHKMKRMDDYYGLFNDKINFDTIVKAWWDIPDNKKKICYDTIKDYNINIKNIINIIIQRPTLTYNSLLISEEKIKINQFSLVNRIIADFPKLFVIIYHGKCLRLYLSSIYIDEIKKLSKLDSRESVTSKRLWQEGGIYGLPINKEYKNDNQNLPNDYCYFDINTKILNIKLIYKLLKMLFIKSSILIDYKTVITITGKYGERGYSFTSDDYGEYSFHLTDQYFVSHASFNCTDISQRLRLQGKYNDLDLTNNLIKLTLWTTDKLHDIIQNFYVKFIKQIEKSIMNCMNWEEIRNILENIIDKYNGFDFKYMKYIDVSKKRKNITTTKKIDIYNNANLLLCYNNMTNTEITEWCNKHNLPAYKCVNEIKYCNSSEYYTNIYNNELIPGIPYKINLRNIEHINTRKFKYLTSSNKQEFRDLIKDDLPSFFIESKYELMTKKTVSKYDTCYEVRPIKDCILKNEPKKPDKNCKNKKEYNLLIVANDIPEFNVIKGDCFITYYIDDTNILELNINSNPSEKKQSFITEGKRIKYLSLKTKYQKHLPTEYYWKGLDGNLYLTLDKSNSINALKITEHN